MDRLESEGRDQGKKMFVHDISVSFQYMYPYDLEPAKILKETLRFVKGNEQLREFQDIICGSECSHKLFNNLFWLFFCLKFQSGSFSELGNEYKKEIKEQYSALYYSLHKAEEGTSAFDNEELDRRRRKLPFIYSWAIIKKYHDLFKKSIAEFTQKFLLKCCQIVMFEKQKEMNNNTKYYIN